jgi:hypothetical protein
VSGRAVTDFTHHLLTEDEWKSVTAVGNDVRLGTPVDSPLLRQRGRDVYVAVVRRPDRPWLQANGSTVQLVPGESHHETAGYHFQFNGRKVTNRLVRPGEKLPLNAPGEYAAVAVEWSGVESEPDNVVNIAAPAKLEVLAEPPPDFRWTRDRWLLNDREISPEIAAKSAAVTREVLHRHDGVIAREWHERGVLARHHDLNHEGKAIRRLTYEGGRLASRDYHNRDDQHVSRQVFAPDEFITETIILGNNNGQTYETDYWWYDRGTPVRRIAGGSQFVKEGEKWSSSPYRP